MLLLGKARRQEFIQRKSLGKTEGKPPSSKTTQEQGWGRRKHGVDDQNPEKVGGAEAEKGGRNQETD